MWKAVTAILILALIAAGAVFILPTVVEEHIVDALKQQTAAEDVQISITDSPRLVFGEIGAVDGVMRQGRVGKLFVRELTVSGTGLKVDMMTLLREHKVELTSADSVQMRGVVDADAVRELIGSSSGKFEGVEVKVEPGKVLATAETKAFGQTFDVTIDGAFSVADGDLYYKARRISARGLGLNALSLDSILPDILVAHANSLPLGLAFESVEARDGVVVLTAGK